MHESSGGGGGWWNPHARLVAGRQRLISQSSLPGVTRETKGPRVQPAMSSPPRSRISIVQQMQTFVSKGPAVASSDILILIHMHSERHDHPVLMRDAYITISNRKHCRLPLE